MPELVLNRKKAFELIEKYGSPLYVYDEKILRNRCNQMKTLLPEKIFKANYSVKANTNLEILKIVKEEGLNADAMSPGEIFMLEKAGFLPEQIFFVPNNVNKDEMIYALDRGIVISADSISQLRLIGSLKEGAKVSVRFNPGIGAGHHEKVITGGKKTKFGVPAEDINLIKEVLLKYKLHLVGINQHIGSLFMDEDKYIDSVKSILSIAKEFSHLEFIDMGGGFGIPYGFNEMRLNIKALSQKLNEIVNKFISEYDNKNILFKSEPGRYVVAEAGIILGTVTSIKNAYGFKYVGTDVGFNILSRPIMYDAQHEITVFNREENVKTRSEKITLVGNICESGDILAKNRKLNEVFENDIILIHDCGAYGYCMSSNYNMRLRPAEVLITLDGTDKLIRRRENFEDLLSTMI